MRTAAVFSLVIFFAIGMSSAQAGDAETIEEVNQGASKLDKAFEQQDHAAIEHLMTPDHVAVTPYYDGPQSFDDQIASLADLKYKQTNLSEAEITLLGSDVAQRSFSAELNGTFKGKRIPRQVFISAIWVKRDGNWQERFYQVTALRPGGKHACRGLAGTYLTENVMDGRSADGFASRSLLSLGRSGLALFTDSGEGGEAGFAPFTDGRGAWRCLSGDGGTIEVSATTFDFTEPDAEHPKAGRYRPARFQADL